LFESIVIVHVDWVPAEAQSPPQPAKEYPFAALADSETCVPTV
jgi:hypothetical protein